MNTESKKGQYRNFCCNGILLQIRVESLGYTVHLAELAQLIRTFGNSRVHINSALYVCPCVCVRVRVCLFVNFCLCVFASPSKCTGTI